MKIFVLGSTGMLGKYVDSYFNARYDTISLSRKDINAAEMTEVVLYDKLFQYGLSKGDVIINCVGAIKPIVDKLGDLNAIQINSVFPRILANVAVKCGVSLIHPTTDCVFAGTKGGYTETDAHDIKDVYGRTKSLGEPLNCTVIRTSIIGEEVNQSRSLVEWVKSQDNKNAFGFTNHIWNGVTCLQFAKICEIIINKNLYWHGVKHIYSNNITKYELLNLIASIYNLNINITAKEAEEHCDRSLSSNFNFCKDLNIPNLETQIKEMKNFSKTLYS